MMGLLKKIVGDPSQRQLNKWEKVAQEIEGLADRMKALSDAELREKTDEFKKRLQDGETLDDLLPDAFAVVREASKRVLGMTPYHVQLLEDRYVVTDRTLGDGAHAVVYLATDVETGQQLACKVHNLDRRPRSHQILRRIKQEAMLLSYLDHVGNQTVHDTDIRT